MAKTNLKEQAEASSLIPNRKVHGIHPWEVQHHPEHSEIEAYIEINARCEIIAVIKGINHVEVADFLTGLANEHNQKAYPQPAKTSRR